MTPEELYEKQMGSPCKNHYVACRDAIELMKLWGRYCARKVWNDRSKRFKHGVITFDNYWKEVEKNEL